MNPDWKAITNRLVERNREIGYGYVSLLQLWTPDTAPDLTVGGHEMTLVDVLPGEELVLKTRKAGQKQLRRWLWGLRESRALSPQRLGRTVVWHMWDQDTGETVFGIATFTRYDVGDRLEDMRSKESQHA